MPVIDDLIYEPIRRNRIDDVRKQVQERFSDQRPFHEIADELLNAQCGPVWELINQHTLDMTDDELDEIWSRESDEDDRLRNGPVTGEPLVPLAT